MTPISLLVISTTLSLMLIGCSSKNTIPDNPPAELYATAKKKLQSGHFKDAIKQLEALDSRYPFGPYSQQVQLDLIYVYYKSTDLVLAQTSIDRFMRLNATHPDIDYVLYMRGLINMSLDDNLLHSFFGIDRSDRDPQYARNAFRDFRELVQNYPGSQYVADSNKRLVFLKNKLAHYELAIAEYYTRREAYVAVVNRIEQMMKNYPDTQATRHGLPLMKKAYEELGLTVQANKIDKLIAANDT